METLKEKVKKSGLKQIYIANKIGITKEHLNYMLNGKREMEDKYKIEILNLINKMG